MNRYVILAGLAGILVACGDGTPFTTTTTTTSDPNTNANQRYLYDEARFLVANQFTYNATNDTIVINNLPFDGVSSSDGQYTPHTSGGTAVVLPNGAEVFGNTPGTGENQYYAVIVKSGTTTALAGAIGTNSYRGFGYGGAYTQRPSGGLPASRAATYNYSGNYGGVRVIRQENTAAADSVQLTTGVASLEVDLQDLDAGGSIKGRISGRQVWDVNGNLIGALDTIILNETTIDTSNTRSNDATADTLNIDGTQAQSGSWEGSFSGPNGEQIVGYVVIEGDLSDNVDVNFDGTNAVEGREIGGFVTTQTP